MKAISPLKEIMGI